MAETQESYQSLIETKRSIEEELAIPRCANCDHNILGRCEQFAADIPEDHKYAYTDCKFWIKELPF